MATQHRHLFRPSRTLQTAEWFSEPYHEFKLTYWTRTSFCISTQILLNAPLLWTTPASSRSAPCGVILIKISFIFYLIATNLWLVSLWRNTQLWLGYILVMLIIEFEWIQVQMQGDPPLPQVGSHPWSPLHTSSLPKPVYLELTCSICLASLRSKGEEQ